MKVPLMLRLIRRYREFQRNWKIKGLPHIPEPPYTHFTQFGDPVLREISVDVPKDLIQSKEIGQLIYRMKALIKNTSVYCLTAPQIGIGLRVMAVYCPDPELSNGSDYLTLMEKQESIVARGVSFLPLQFWINPTMKVLDYKQSEHLEECSSIRGIAAEVKRYKKIQLIGFDENGKIKEAEFSDWHARLIQHEIDHLNGVFFTDKMSPKTLICPYWELVNRFRGHCDLKYL